MVPAHSSSISTFFSDPVVNLVLKNPVARAWILNDMPDPLSALNADDPNQVFINCASIRPSPNTYKLLSMLMNHSSRRNNHRDHSTCRSPRPSQGHGSVDPSPYHDAQHFAGDFENEPGMSLYAMSHIVDGFGLGNIYECVHDRKAVQSQTLIPLNDDTDEKPLLRKFALVLEADELLILQIARYENGSVLFQSHRTLFKQSSFTLHYYLFDRLPHFIEFYIQNNHPLSSLQCDAFSANLIMNAMLTQKRQCPACALARNICSCPDSVRNTFLPSMYGAHFSLQNFLKTYEVFKNASFFSTVVLQTSKKVVHLECFLDLAASCGAVKTYDFARDVYCRFYMSPKTIPRILDGWGSNLSGHFLGRGDPTQLSCIQRAQGETLVGYPQTNQITFQREHNDIDEILKNPVKFFLRLRISGDCSTTQDRTNVITFLTNDKEQNQQPQHLLQHFLLYPLQPLPLAELCLDMELNYPESLSASSLTKFSTGDDLSHELICPATPADISELPGLIPHQLSFPAHVDMVSAELPEQHDWFGDVMAQFVYPGSEDFDSESVPHSIDIDNIFCFPEAFLAQQCNSKEMPTIFNSLKFQEQPKVYKKENAPAVPPSKNVTKSEVTVSLLGDRQCKICGRVLNRPADLKRHFKTVHERERLFNCADCNAGFQLRWHLNEHKRVIHGGDKPFTCDLCHLSFARRGDINKHVKVVHEKIRNFSCKECEMKFFQRSDLKRHVAEKHAVSQIQIPT